MRLEEIARALRENSTRLKPDVAGIREVCDVSAATAASVSLGLSVARWHCVFCPDCWTTGSRTIAETGTLANGNLRPQIAGR